MAKYNDKTARGWPLPNKNNRLYDDVERLREALTLIDETITGVERHEGAIEDRQDFLSTRLDTVIEGATEDTEILDARVDAEGNVHPNLGHNVRNIHSGLLQAVSDIKYGIQEFQGLLHQFSAIAEAQIQDELNVQDANERRKAELAQETLVRLLQDKDVQQQINKVSEATMLTAVTLRELSERRRAELNHEESERISSDDSLQREINALAEAFLSDALTLNETLKHQRDALKCEIEARIAGDAALQERIQQELEQRTEHDTQQDVEISRHEQELLQERQIRDEQDEGLQRQADSNAEANIQTALTLQEVNARRKADLTREEQARIAGDIALKELIDKTAEASLENTLGIDQEAQQRRKSDKRIEALRDEAGRRIEIDAYHQLQIDEAINAILQNSLALSEALARRRAALIREEQSRVEEDTNLQGQTDTNAKAIMRNTLNIQQEAEHRRKLLDRIAEEAQERERQIQSVRLEISELYEIPLPGLREELAEIQRQTDTNAEANIRTALNLNDAIARRTALINQETQWRFAEDAGTQRQVNANAEGILQNALNLSEAFGRYREALTQEAHTRVYEDANIQAQADSNATATLELMANLSAEAEKRRVLRQILVSIKSLVDCSEAEILRQIASLAEADMQSELNHALLNAERRHEEAQEREIRDEQDAGLQAQMNQLAVANMWLAVCGHETREKINKVSQSISGSSGVASDSEVDEMLDEIYNS